MTLVQAHALRAETTNDTATTTKTIYRMSDSFIREQWDNAGSGNWGGTDYLRRKARLTK
jgi:predicted SnoaL-like aldol condensation-catalyzing enzyme